MEYVLLEKLRLLFSFLLNFMRKFPIVFLKFLGDDNFHRRLLGT